MAKRKRKLQRQYDREQKAGSSNRASVGQRLVSLDAYRGAIMLLLASGGFGILKLSQLAPDNSVWKIWDYDSFQSLAFHVDHPPWVSITGWIGVSLWDLIQPAFMFMVGVAMPFSYARRSVMGSSRGRRLFHAVVRAVVLILLGVLLRSKGQEHTNWSFMDVISQIGLGYLFAYAVLSWTPQMQVAAIATILVGYWGWFMLNPPPDNFDYSSVKVSAEKGEVFEGRFAPWSKNANAAHFFDVAFLNALRDPEVADVPAVEGDTAGDDAGGSGQPEDSQDSTPTPPADVAEQAQPGGIRHWFFSSPERFDYHSGGYQTLNFIPSIATMIFGIICGQLLMSSETNSRKLLTLLIMGIACLALGVLAHHTVCPIVKRIWTPSWTLFAAGYTIWMLAGFFLVFDMLPLQELAFPLVVVGMNSIAVFVMIKMMRGWIGEAIITPHFSRLLQSVFGPDAINMNGLGRMVMPTVTVIVIWLIAFWMHRNRFFVRV